MAGRHEGSSPGHPRKVQIAAVVAGNGPQATVAAVVDMTCGKVAGADIAGHHTASYTTIGRLDRPGKVNERWVGCMVVDNRGLGKTGWSDSRNGQVAAKGTT